MALANCSTCINGINGMDACDNPFQGINTGKEGDECCYFADSDPSYFPNGVTLPAEVKKEERPEPTEDSSNNSCPECGYTSCASRGCGNCSWCFDGMAHDPDCSRA